MKKILFFAAAAVAMLTGCSQNDDLTAPTVQNQTEDTPISFGTYMGYSGQTRAGSTGDIVDYNATSGHKLGSAGYEFGVFAYLTGTTYPNVAASEPGSIGANSNKPDFMFNQKVDYNITTASAWGYSPLKYWPNGEVSSTDNNADNADATSTSLNYLSFFAYAPYVTKAAANGTGTGITGMSDNNATGNPTITYKMAANQANVDLLWGTYNGGDGYEVVHGSDKQTGGKVWGTEGANIKNYGVTNVNLTKQQKDQKVKFLFKHALAKIAGGSAEKNSKMGLMIKVDPDQGENFGDNATEANRQTVVTVKEIKIKNNDANNGGTPAVYTYPKETVGTLDLATGIWSHPLDKTQDLFSQTIKPSATGTEIEINPAIKEMAVTSEVQANAYWTTYLTISSTGDHPGVTKTARPVYATEQTPLLYFPGETPSLEVEIEYVVRTKDPNLELGYSEVTQKIKKTVTFASPVQMNKYYGLTIILGLTSVKFEATVANWEPDGTEDGDDVSGNDTTPIYLPINVD